MSRLLPALIAVLAPAFVMGATIFFLARAPAHTVVPEVAALDARLAASPPDIVLVGNSKTTTDIDQSVLTALGTPPLKIGVLQAYGALAPTWYAMLRYRVFDKGYHPRLVLVTADVPSMLESVPTGRGLVTLGQQMDAPDAILEQKALGGSAVWARMREKRGKWRENLQDGLRDGAVSCVFGGGVGRDALARVFAQGAARVVGERRGIPVVEAARKSRATPDIHATFLADFVALAKENGARVVFVALPFSPSALRADHAEPEREAAAIALLNETGGGWVDLRSLPLGDADFVDDLHMNARGRTVASAALAAKLVAMGALSSGELRDAVLPVRPATVERIGVPTALPALQPVLRKAPCGWVAGAPAVADISEPLLVAAGWPKEAAPVVVWADGTALARRRALNELGPECHGAYAHFRAGVQWSAPREGSAGASLAYATDVPLVLAGHGPAYWIYPGTTVRVTMADGWTGGDFQVNVRVKAFGTGSGELVVNGVSQALSEEPVVVTGPPPAGPWTIEIRSPAAGPAFLVDHLGFGAGDSRGTFIGDEAPPSIRLFDQPPRYANPPPVVGAGAATRSLHADLLAIPPELSFGAETLLKAQLPPCSPMRAVDGLGTLGALKLGEVRAGKIGSVGTALGVLFNPPAGRVAAGFAPALDPERRCRGTYWWLYPGDTLTVDARETRIHAVHVPLTRLALRLHAISDPGAGAVGVALTADDGTPFRTTVPLTDFRDSEVVIPLPPGFVAKRSLSLTLALPGDAPFVLIESAALDG